MPNPFLDDLPSAGGRNPFLDDSPAGGNPFLDGQPSSGVPAPQRSMIGRAIDPIVNAGTTAVSKLFAVLDTPQNALQGAVAEGMAPEGEGALKGFVKGLTREKDYATSDILDAAGWKEDTLARKAVGLAGDLVLDPLNLVGVGALKSGYQAGVRGLGKAVKTGIESKPVAGTALKAVNSLLDPHAALARGTEGLKDKARLWESGARATSSAAEHDAAQAIATHSYGPFTTTPKKDVLSKIAYAIDEGKVASLAPEEQKIAGKVSKTLDDQFESELKTGHQGQQVNPKTGEILAEGAPKLPNYVPLVTKADAKRNVSIIGEVQGTSRFSKDRELDSLKTAVNEFNATDDLGEMVKARLLTGRRAQHSADVIEDAVKTFGSVEAKKGFRKLNIPGTVKLPQGRASVLKDMHVPEDVADYVERAHAIWSEPDEVSGVIKNAVKVYKGWLVTTPQQGITNLVGNVVNAFVSGNGKSVAPTKLYRALNVVIEKSPMPDIVAASGKKFSGAEIKAAASKFEILGGAGQYHDIVDKGKNFTLNPLKANNAFGKSSQYLNQHVVEEPFKLSLFLDKIKETGDLEKAALATKNTFFDYAEVSDSAKKLRDFGVAPFITWQLKNIPFQLKNLAENPHKYAQMQSMYEGVTNPDTIVPHKDEREGLVPIGGPDHLVRFANPINDLNKIPIPGLTTGEDVLTDTLGGMVPFWKAPLEMANSTGREGEWGKQFYNQQPIVRKGAPGAPPMDTYSNFMQMIGLPEAAGISSESGYPKQNEVLSYVLKQMPWQFWGRNFAPTPQELIDKGVQPQSNWEQLGGFSGFRNKDVSPSAKLREIEARLKHQGHMEP